MPRLRTCLLTIAAAPAGAPASSAQAPTQYRVPADNPFVAVADARPEIYDYGLRNPFRWSFDRQTGDLTVGDVGQDAREEIDFVPAARAAGVNFGWNCFEGTLAGPGGCDPPNDLLPALDYPNAHPSAVTGGYVVRDPTLPALTGRYLYGDFFAGDVLSTGLTSAGATAPVPTGLNVPQLVAFGEDGIGHLLAVSLAGPVYRLIPGATAGSLDKSSVGSFDSPM